MVGQLVKKSAMTADLRKKWEKRLFHQVKSVAQDLKATFGILLFREVQEADQNFVTRCFARRHVYEHCGGEVDQKYLEDRGEKKLKLGQSIYETQESVGRLVNILEKITENLHRDFHEIFPPQEKAISDN